MGFLDETFRDDGANQEPYPYYPPAHYGQEGYVAADGSYVRPLPMPESPMTPQQPAQGYQGYEQALPQPVGRSLPWKKIIGGFVLWGAILNSPGITVNAANTVLDHTWFANDSPHKYTWKDPIHDVQSTVEVTLEVPKTLVGAVKFFT